MYSKFKPLLITVEDKNLLLSEISRLRSTLYSVANEAFEEMLHASVRSEVASILKELFKEGQKEQILKTLESELESLDIVHLSLAYQPDEKFLETISQAIQSGEQYRLLDLEIKPSLVGGIEISSAGKFANFSLQKKLDEFCTSTEFQSLLKPYFSA